MKKIWVLSFIIAASFSFQDVQAQVNVSVNLGSNGTNPGYYYLPDANAYYHVPTRVYYYSRAGRWTSARYLPGHSRTYNIYKVRHIPVYETRPYLKHRYYEDKYRRTVYKRANKHYYKSKKHYNKKHRGYYN